MRCAVSSVPCGLLPGSLNKQATSARLLPTLTRASLLLRLMCTCMDILLEDPALLTRTLLLCLAFGIVRAPQFPTLSSFATLPPYTTTHCFPSTQRHALCPTPYSLVLCCCCALRSAYTSRSLCSIALVNMSRFTGRGFLQGTQ